MKINDIPVLILAGGLGTRLRGLYPDIPKPIVPIDGKPYIEILIEFLEKKGFKNFTISVGYKKEMIKKTLEHKGYNISFVEEETPLGTGGAVRNALEVFSPRALVVNGDTYLDIDYERFLDFHLKQNKKNGSLCSICLVYMDDTKRFGNVIFEGNRLKEFSEKDTKTEGPGWINGGVYIIEREFVNLIPKEIKSSFEKDVIPKAIKKNILISVFKTDGTFYDIGTPESLSKFIEFYKNKKQGKHEDDKK